MDNAEVVEFEDASFCDSPFPVRQSMKSFSRSQPSIPGARIGDARHTKAICKRNDKFFGFIVDVNYRSQKRLKKIEVKFGYRNTHQSRLPNLKLRQIRMPLPKDRRITVPPNVLNTEPPPPHQFSPTIFRNIFWQINIERSKSSSVSN